MSQKVCVIMPTYNRKFLICKSIESILNQTFTDFVLFIIDDGSTDNTKEVIKPYLNDSRVKYIYQENKGEAEAVNIGWNLSTGVYFTQVNSDDTITKNSFEIMVNYMDRNPQSVLGYPDFNFIDQFDNIINTTKSPRWNFLKALSSFSCYAASPGTFIRRAPFVHLNTIKSGQFKHINDIEMYWNMALVGDFLHIPHVLANWRIHSDQISYNRYNAIPEITEWFYNYFNSKLLPEKVRNAKNQCSESILKYFSSLIDQSNLTTKDKKSILSESIQHFYKKNYTFSCVYVGDSDLIGNKFNGHNIHITLRNKGINANHIVCKKLSNDISTYMITDTNNYSFSIINNHYFAYADLVHLHLIHNTPFDINYLPTMSKLKPTVITMHDPFFIGGHCVYHGDCTKWHHHCVDCDRLDAHFLLYEDCTALNFEIKKNAIQNSNISAIVASEWMKKKVMQSPIWANKPIYLVPFGVDQKLFKPADNTLAKVKLGIDQDSFVIFTRTQKHFKGLSILKKTFNNFNLKQNIVIITVGEKFLLTDLPNNIKCKEFGWLCDDTKLVELYQACDVFLMPSEQEAFGMMAIEAMSCGKMVLALDTPESSLPDVINSPKCGLAVTEAEYSDTLLYLYENTSELTRRGKECLAYANKYYKYEDYVLNLLNAYDQIMHGFEPSATTKITIEQLMKYNPFLPNHNNTIHSLDTLGSHNLYKSRLIRLYDYYIHHGLNLTIKKILNKIVHKISRVFHK